MLLHARTATISEAEELTQRKSKTADRGRRLHRLVPALRRALAVGTAISGRPPHRSVRAELLHTAPTFDADVRSVLQDTDGGYVDWGAIDCRSS